MSAISSVDHTIIEDCRAYDQSILETGARKEGEGTIDLNRIKGDLAKFKTIESAALKIVNGSHTNDPRVVRRVTNYQLIAAEWNKANPTKKVSIPGSAPAAAATPPAGAASNPAPPKPDLRTTFTAKFNAIVSGNPSDFKQKAIELISELSMVGSFVGKEELKVTLRQLRDTSSIGTPVSASALVSSPTSIRNDGKQNCFLSSIFWVLFLNEPIFEEELRNNISNLVRIEEKTQEQNDTLDSLYEIDNFMQLCKKDQTITGRQIGTLRNTLSRLTHGGFRNANSTQQEDAQDAFNELAQAMLGNSNMNQVQSITRLIQLAGSPELSPAAGVNLQTGEKNIVSDDKNWGKFNLPVMRGRTVKHHLQSLIFAKNDPNHPTIEPMKLKTKTGENANYTVLGETTKLQFAPPLLVLNFKRTDIAMVDGAPYSYKIDDPISAEEILKLEKEFFVDDDAAVYELVGVVSHNGNTPMSGHFVADFKTKENKYFHGDDTHNPSVVLKDTAAHLRNAADTGYILVYRKKN